MIQYIEGFENVYLNQLGEEELRQELNKIIYYKGVKNRVFLMGFDVNLYKYLKAEDLFFLGSNNEGFPDAHIENYTFVTPIIAFNIPRGNKELIENIVYGYLVENESALLSKLNSLGQFDPKQVSDSVMKKFGKDIILKQYEDFFEEITRKNNGN